MNKVDVVLAITAAAMNWRNDPRINAMYALIAVNRNQLQWICQGQPDNGDIMAHDAVLFAVQEGGKPAFLTQAGL